MKKHIVEQNYQVSVTDRRIKHQHSSFLIWFTGLSGSGKSTFANLVEQRLFQLGVHTYSLDGDNVRHGLNADLGFSPDDRTENIRRISEVGKLMVDAGVVVLAAFVSPYKKDREKIKNTLEDPNFVEVYVNTSVEECERRDVKGLYKKARAGEIKNMTGISAPYEAPNNPDIEIKTEEVTVEQAVDKIVAYITPKLQLHNE